MVKKYAKVENDTIVNITVWPDDTACPGDHIDVTDIQAGPGWAVVDGVPVQPEPEPVALSEAEQRRQDMLTGVEFDGVMCSATAEDQHGLTDVKPYVLADMVTKPFRFENGNRLLLTADNIEAFEAIWFPFRESFF